MFRKLFTGMFLLGLGTYLWAGTSVGSYVRTAYCEVVGYVSGQVPVDLKIKRARQLLHDVVPEVHKTKKLIAEEEVKLSRLRREADSITGNLDKERVNIIALREAVKNGENTFVVGGVHYSKNAVEKELNRQFNSFKRIESNLKAKREVVAAREEGLLAARAKHDQLIELKQQLETELENLDAEYKMVQVKQMSKGIQIDDSRVENLRKALEEIAGNIEVEKKMAEDDGKLFRQIDTEKTTPANIGEQVDEYFKVPAKQPKGMKL